ncbi:hypothetical protein LINGRAHAP2_LOCUS31374 [Linum grandiflorum]
MSDGKGGHDHIEFMYENLPDFCYCYGYLGHTISNCEIRKTNVVFFEKNPTRYGNHMRIIVPMKRNYKGVISPTSGCVSSIDSSKDDAVNVDVARRCLHGKSLNTVDLPSQSVSSTSRPQPYPTTYTSSPYPAHLHTLINPTSLPPEPHMSMPAHHLLLTPTIKSPPVPYPSTQPTIPLTPTLSHLATSATFNPTSIHNSIPQAQAQSQSQPLHSPYSELNPCTTTDPHPNVISTLHHLAQTHTNLPNAEILNLSSECLGQYLTHLNIPHITNSLHQSHIPSLLPSATNDSSHLTLQLHHPIPLPDTRLKQVSSQNLFTKRTATISGNLVGKRLKQSVSRSKMVLEVQGFQTGWSPSKPRRKFKPTRAVTHTNTSPTASHDNADKAVVACRKPPKDQ